MDYGSMLGDSLDYTRDLLWGKWKRWILLIPCTIIFPLLLGYIMEIYRGKQDPELEGWGRLFIDGLKYFVASLIYALPAILIMLVFGGIALLDAIARSAASGSPDPLAGNPQVLAPALFAFGIGIILAILVGLAIALLSIIGLVRMARTDRFGEAFNFGAILDHIARIGWSQYIVALIVIWVVSIVLGAALSALAGIPFIGWIFWLFLTPAVVIFESRYIALVYDSGTRPHQPA
ncbi:MAG: DUF4013 domain-containing protein [Methanomicrobiales archaeon]|nr:DUF4013 domain-containing protein [Methanomicrobiales archaeon]